jgi:hypothetical protein
MSWRAAVAAMIQAVSASLVCQQIQQMLTQLARDGGRPTLFSAALKALNAAHVVGSLLVLPIELPLGHR